MKAEQNGCTELALETRSPDGRKNTTDLEGGTMNESLGDRVNMTRYILIIGLVAITGDALAGTVLDFWHPYTRAQTHQTHYSFHVTQYKRGLFWGSCGPSTKSQQWSFNFDLAGEGPVYSSQDIGISDDNGKVLRVVSGEVRTDMKRGRSKIEVEIESGGHTNKFIGNGEYAIKKIFGG